MIDLRRMDVSTKNFDDCPPVKTYVYVASRQPQDELVRCFASLDSDSEVFKVLFNYALQVYKADADDFKAQIKDYGGVEMPYLDGSMMDQLVQRNAPKWLGEGKDIGRSEGITIGKDIGKGESLLLLLEKRFGELSEDIKNRVKDATADQINAWLIAVLTAKSLDSVFQPSQLN